MLISVIQKKNPGPREVNLPRITQLQSVKKDTQWLRVFKDQADRYVGNNRAKQKGVSAGAQVEACGGLPGKECRGPPGTAVHPSWPDALCLCDLTRILGKARISGPTRPVVLSGREECLGKGAERRDSAGRVEEQKGVHEPGEDGFGLRQWERSLQRETRKGPAWLDFILRVGSE